MASWVRRAVRPANGDGGAASLEYAGFLAVIVMVIGALTASVTPVGDAIKVRICAALDVACGSAAAEERAEDLNIRCIVSNRDRNLGFNGSYAGIRVDRKDTDTLTEYGDGTGLVVMSQGGGAGVDGSTGFTSAGSINAQATVNSDLGYVYSFPTDYGGAEAASDFIGSERGGVGQAVDIVVPGAQTIDEGLTRGVNGTRNLVEDYPMSWVGLGPSAEERAARDRSQRAGTADAVRISLSTQGAVGLDFGAGVKKKGADGESETLGGPVNANASLKVEVRGASTVGLHSGEADSVASSFTGSARIDAEAGIGLGLPATESGGTDIPPFLNLSGQAGAAGSYVVVFDENGEPASLVIKGEYYYGGQAQFKPPKIGGQEFKFAAGARGASVTERSLTLDLDTSTPEGRLNREAFDDAFTVGSVSAGGSTGAVAVPNVLTASQVAQWWPQLSDRLDADAFIVDSTYSQEGDDGEIGAKVAGTGLGGTKGETSRQLLDATSFDNRNGGVEVALASCGG